MSRELAMILLASVVGLTLVVGCRDLVRGRPRQFMPSAFLLALSAAVYAFAFPDSNIQTKGPIQEGVAVAFCYVSMALGMVAQYYYKQAERGDTKFTFEPMEFLMPIFASPIVFIPLLTITADMSFSGAFTKAKLMVYLVAFQNGFFWKSFFEQRQKNVEQEALRMV
jgi:hypothetical protein